MDSKTFFDNFETIANAPGGIARLRELILDLAVRGKITPFEPAEHNMSHTYSCPGISMDIPSHWGILSFEKHFDMKGGGQPPKSTFVDAPKDGYIRLYQIRDYGPNPVPVYVPKELAPRKTRKGDILIARYGASGKVFWAVEGAYNVALAKLLFPEDLYLDKYAFLMFSSGGFQQAVRGTTRVAVDGFNKNDLKNVYFPLPPLNEQRRIVEKVEELMALCDEIEVVQNQRNSIRTAARKSAIDAISAASTSEELNAAWNRISQNWLTISDTLESVSSLRSMILDLAVRGRLLAEHNPTSWDERGFPTNWISESLEAAAEYVQRGKGPKYATKSEVAVVSQKCVKWSGFDISEARFIDASSLSSYKEDRFLRSGDLLWNSTGTGTVGRTALFHEVDDFPKVVADSHVTVIRAPRIMPRFLWIWSASPSIQSEVLGLTTGSTNQQELNLSTIKGLVIAIPPMEEQRRVVDKVDELMELCNQLELSLILRNELIKKISGSLANDATA